MSPWSSCVVLLQGRWQPNSLAPDSQVLLRLASDAAYKSQYRYLFNGAISRSQPHTVSYAYWLCCLVYPLSSRTLRTDGLAKATLDHVHTVCRVTDPLKACLTSLETAAPCQQQTCKYWAGVQQVRLTATFTSEGPARAACRMHHRHSVQCRMHHRHILVAGAVMPTVPATIGLAYAVAAMIALTCG